MCPYLELSRSLPAPQRPLKPSARLLLQSRSESGRWRHLRPSWSTNQRTKSLGCFSSCSSTAAERAPHPPRTTQRFSSIQKTRFLLLKAGNVLKYLSSGAQTLAAPTVPSGSGQPNFSEWSRSRSVPPASPLLSTTSLLSLTAQLCALQLLWRLRSAERSIMPDIDVCSHLHPAECWVTYPDFSEQKAQLLLLI